MVPWKSFHRRICTMPVGSNSAHKYPTLKHAVSADSTGPSGPPAPAVSPPPVAQTRRRARRRTGGHRIHRTVQKPGRPPMSPTCDHASSRRVRRARAGWPGARLGSGPCRTAAELAWACMVSGLCLPKTTCDSLIAAVSAGRLLRKYSGPPPVLEHGAPGAVPPQPTNSRVISSWCWAHNGCAVDPSPLLVGPPPSAAVPARYDSSPFLA